MTESALLVEIPEAEPHVAKWRQLHDPAAADGIPGHITAVFPFVPPPHLDGEVLDRVRKLVVGFARMDFRLERLDEFPGVLWLRPEPDAAFRQLTSALVEAFPAYPPYEGRFADSQPHLTVAMVDAGASQRALRSEIELDLGDSLPLACTADALSVFCSDRHNVWRRTHRFAFGAAGGQGSAAPGSGSSGT
jgi:hypothetical protein